MYAVYKEEQGKDVNPKINVKLEANKSWNKCKWEANHSPGPQISSSDWAESHPAFDRSQSAFAQIVWCLHLNYRLQINRRKPLWNIIQMILQLNYCLQRKYYSEKAYPIHLRLNFFLDQLLCKKMMIEIKLSPTWWQDQHNKIEFANSMFGLKSYVFENLKQ